MKKTALILIAVMMCSLVLAGCGKTTQQTDETFEKVIEKADGTKSMEVY